jgi:large subunit ribosomal protein L22
MSPTERRTTPEEGWESLTVGDLQEELEARGLKKSGKKDELVARLEEDDSSPQSPLPSPQEEGADAEPARRRAAAETTPEPAPKVAPRQPDGSVVVRARAKYVRSAPRKARLVMGHIRGKPVDRARALLAHTPRAVSSDILKLLNSAVANAESNYELAGDELTIAKAYVDEGPVIKRYRPRALGRATRINKRTSHMTIELTTREDVG